MLRLQYFFRYFANELKDRQNLPADTGECDVDGTGSTDCYAGDGLFSSNLLGNDAFIAVSVSLPIVNAVSVLTMICERGGAV